MKKPSILLICLLITTSSFGQKKLIEKFLKNDTTRNNSFLPVPVLGYAQELGFEFGLAGMYAFYTDKEDLQLRPSNIYLSGVYTTKGSYQVVSKWDVWQRENKLHYQGEARFINFPFNFYGTGNQTQLADEDLLTLRRLRLTADAEKAMSNTIYLGLGIQYDQQKFTDQQAGGLYSQQPDIFDKDGGRVLLIGFSQIIDSRNVNTYPERGFYLKSSYQYAPDFFGGDNFTGSMFRLDLRNFQKLNHKTILGLNLIYNKVDGRDGNPFYLLSQLGGDQIMRGYYLGRYRDANLMAAQAELRYRPIPRLGFALFAGAGNVYPMAGDVFRNIKPNFGGGLRYFFDLDKNLNLRLDYGLGEKPAGEKRISGFYISLGEAF